MDASALEGRSGQIRVKDGEPFAMTCDKESLAGAVSQRACVFCGARVVLYPIADALHLVHGPVGCAAYTWDIRGALSSGPELHRLSFSTDLKEREVVFGGEEKLYKSLIELIDRYAPKAAFVYSTCIVGIIGDDMAAVCRRVEREKGIPVIPVQSEGFKGNKRAGYYAACAAMMKLVGTGDISDAPKVSVNLLGDFNLAGEIWIIRDYLTRMGVSVVANVTGDGRVGELGRAHGAALNVVQCSGSTMEFAKMMKEKYGVPFIRASWFGIDDVADSLYRIADFFAPIDPGIEERTSALVREEVEKLLPVVERYRKDLEGKKAALYVGGAFKAFSLVKAFRLLGMKVVVAGSQTGTEEDYQELHEVADRGTVIVDDTNPLELVSFMKEKGVDVLVGGVKERPIAYKLGVGFCDHNHERKEALEGFIGMANFAAEIHRTVMSPVWRFVPRAGEGAP